jgi:uncharacterized membrane protein YeiH
MFQLPLFFDIGATLIWGATGASLGVRRGYDVTGIFVMAFVSALGGGLIRDGIFLQQGPAIAVRGPLYLCVVVIGGLLGTWAAVANGGRKPSKSWQSISDGMDALGLGAYACVGAQMALQLKLGIPSAIFIGVVNGCGGGLLRDILVNRIWMMPGQLLAIVALAGASLFVALIELGHLSAAAAAWTAIAVTFVLRLLAIRFNWRTSALIPVEAIEHEWD